jgi:hypothetical protein
MRPRNWYEVVAGGQMDVVFDLADGLFDSRAEIAAFGGVLDGDVALACLAIDLFGTIVSGGFGELSQ